MTLSIAAALLAAPAFATVQDANGDGMYSFEEVLVAYPALTEETFQSLDGDGDGMLSAEEVATAEDAGVLTPGG